MRDVTRLHGLLLNWKAACAAVVLILVSVLLLGVSEKGVSWSPLWIGKVLPSFAAVLGTSGVFAIVYEVFVRRQQTSHMLEALDLREALVRTGLDDVTTNYMDYDFASQIINADEIIVFVLYAQTWFNRYSVELSRHLEGKNKSLILCVPSLDNHFLEPLAVQFGYEREDLQKRIAEAIQTVAAPAIGRRMGDGSFVRVIAHRVRPSYSLYKFDKRLLVGTYYASKSRRRAPMFEFIDVSGSLYKEFSEDIQEVIDKESEVVFDSSNQTNRLRVFLGDLMPESLARSIKRAEERQGVAKNIE